MLSAVGYTCVVAVALIVAVTSIDRLITTWFKPDLTASAARDMRKLQPGMRFAQMKTPDDVTIRTASMIQTSDDWADKLRDPAFWRKTKPSGNYKPAPWVQPAQKSNFGYYILPLGAPAAVIVVPRGRSKVVEIKEKDDTESEDDTYRTMCVRLCDGAFFPLSFSTTRENFEVDAARCDKTCAGSRMFVYKNPGATLEDMEDLKGQLYKKLPTAFLFRTTYDAGCKCRAHPWEETARDQHRVYALEGQRAKGDKVAAIELVDLKAKIVKAEREAVAEKKRADFERIAEQKKLAEAAKSARAKSRQDAQIARSTAQAAKAGATPAYGAQFKASTGPASAKATATAATANLWGPRPSLVPRTVVQTPATKSVQHNAPFTPVPASLNPRMGLGAR